MNIYVSHSGNYDYEEELYAPIKASGMYQKHMVFLPHTSENTDTVAIDILAKAHMLVAEVSYPSTEQGIEIGLASAGKIPIICFYKEGTKPSSSLRFITEKVMKYSDVADLLTQLETQLDYRDF